MNTKPKSFFRMAGLLAILLAAGCASTEHKKTKATAAAHMAAAEEAYAKNKVPVETERVKETAGFWVNKRSVTIADDAEALPPVFRTDLQLTYNPKPSFRDITTLLSKATGLRFSFASDINEEVNTPFALNSFRTNTTLKQALDQMAAQQNVYWRYTNGIVDIFRYQTKSFKISAIPGASEFNASISNQTTAGNSNGGGSGGGGGASTTTGHKFGVTNKIDLWANIKNDVKQLLSPKGKYSVAESNSVVTVTDTPDGLNAVETYVKSLNAGKEKSVMISVEVYAVESNSSDDYALSWAGVFRNLTEQYSVFMTSPFTGTNNPALGKLSMIIDRNSSSPWAGTQAILGAISAVGTTSLVTTASAITISGESVPVNVTKEVNYLASISTNTNTQTGTQTALTPGVTTAGFSLNTTPLVLEGDNILLQGAIEISSLDKLDTFRSGTSEIQLPQKSSQSFINKVKMRSGQTLMMTGFQQAAHFFNNSGVGSSANMAFGGTRESTSKNVTLVILVTPTIVQ